jgi:hypothetical protein
LGRPVRHDQIVVVSVTRQRLDSRQVSGPERLGATADAGQAERLSREEVKPAMEGSRPGSISVDEFTEATFKAVLRAAEARKAGTGVDREGILAGPIIYGIIWWPEGGPGGEIFAAPER